MGSKGLKAPSGPGAVVALGDNPVVDLEGDVLNYGPFAKDLSRALSKVTPSGGMVLALHGAWGAGKSTMLNFVEHFLTNSAADESGLIVIRFNPWWFSGREDLVRIFFEELVRGLEIRPLAQRAKDALKAVAPLLRVFGKAVSKLPPEFSVGIPGVNLAGSLGAAASQLGEEFNKLGQTPVSSLKVSIEKELKQVSSKILVILDDIDRLTAEEIRLMFRLVKAVANFSNITYLLAYDKRIVVAALGAEQVSGEDFLSKIVQISFELPLPDGESLRVLLEQRLQTLLTNTQTEYVIPTEWSRAYDVSAFEGDEISGIKHFLRTPRDVVRLLNHLSLTYPIVENQVNAVDFITIETLRIHAPAVYDLIRSNPDMFCEGSSVGAANIGAGPPGMGAPIKKRLKETYEPSLRRMVEMGQLSEEDVAPINRLIGQMFPVVATMLRPQGFGTPGLDSWQPRARNKSISYIDIFPLYFRLSPTEHGISAAEAILLSENVDGFKRELQELVESRRTRANDLNQQWRTARARAEVMLRWLAANIDAIPPERAPILLDAIVENIDALPVGLPESSLPALLLTRTPQGERFHLLQKILMAAEIERSLRLVQYIGTPFLGTGTPRPPVSYVYGFDEHPVIEHGEFIQLTVLVADRIKQAAECGAIWNSTHLRFVLTCWYDWGDRKALKDWGTVAIQQRLPELLEKMAEPLLGPPGSGLSNEYRLRPEWLQYFIDPPELVNRAHMALKAIGSPDLRQIVQALDREYEQWKRSTNLNPFSL